MVVRNTFPKRTVPVLVQASIELEPGFEQNLLKNAPEVGARIERAGMSPGTAALGRWSFVRQPALTYSQISRRTAGSGNGARI